MSRCRFPGPLSSSDVSTWTVPHTASPQGSLSSLPVVPDEPDLPLASALLTVAEAAVMLRVSEKTIRRRIKDGTIPIVPAGGRLVRIPANALRRLIAGDSR